MFSSKDGVVELKAGRPQPIRVTPHLKEIQMTDRTNIERRTLITAASGAVLSLALMSKRAAAQTAEQRELGLSSELWRLSASEVARLVRMRKVSAREVADASLQ